jgi:hypothetical protein
VQGAGGVDYLNWATLHFDDTVYLETYQHRAAHMLTLHGDQLHPATVNRLEGLL